MSTQAPDSRPRASVSHPWHGIDPALGGEDRVMVFGAPPSLDDGIGKPSF